MNIGTAVILTALAGVVAMVIRSMVRRRKAGKTCCGDCSRCGSCRG